MIDEMVEAVPDTSNTKSTLSHRLKAGANTCDFALSSKPGS